MALMWVRLGLAAAGGHAITCIVLSVTASSVRQKYVNKKRSNMASYFKNLWPLIIEVKVELNLHISSLLLALSLTDDWAHASSSDQLLVLKSPRPILAHGSAA